MKCVVHGHVLHAADLRMGSAQYDALRVQVHARLPLRSCHPWPTNVAVIRPVTPVAPAACTYIRPATCAGGRA